MGSDIADTSALPDELRALAILVVNYGSHAMVEANLSRSLPAGFPGQVVVVDNYSTDEERAAMTAVCARRGWELVAPAGNEGFGGGNNLAAARAISRGATELLLVNPDAWLELDAIRGLQSQIRADSRLQLAPTVLRPDGSLYCAEMDLQLDLGENRSARRRPAGVTQEQVHTWVSGACFAISAVLWEEIGGFDDDYFLYWEDVDLSRKVILAGGTVRADPTLHAVHDEGSTHRGENAGPAKSPIYYYYNARNRLVYAAKHLPPTDRRRWLRKTPRAAYRLLLQGGKRQFVHPMRTFWPALRGSWHGVLALKSIEKQATA